MWSCQAIQIRQYAAFVCIITAMEGSSDSYVKRLMGSILQLRECGKLCDTLLVTSDSRLLAHSVVLAAASPVLRAAFQSSPDNGCTTYELQLNGLDGRLMERVLNCLYCGHGSLPEGLHSMADAEMVVELCEQLGVGWILDNRDTDRRYCGGMACCRLLSTSASLMTKIETGTAIVRSRFEELQLKCKL